MPKTDYADESPQPWPARQCKLTGDYTLENFCAIMNGLHSTEREWKMVFVVPLAASEQPIDTSQYERPSGDTIFVNPRGEVQLHRDGSHYFYCAEVSPSRVRLVLKGQID